MASIVNSDPAVELIAQTQLMDKVAPSDDHGYNNYSEKVTSSSFFESQKAHKKLIILTTLCTLVIAMLLAFLMEPSYRSTTLLRINADPVKVINYDVEVGQKLSPNKDFFQAEFKLLQSRSVINKTIEELQLQNELHEFTSQKSLLSQSILSTVSLFQSYFPSIGTDKNSGNSGQLPIDIALQNRVTTIPSKDWGLIELTVDWKTANGAARIANSLADNFIEITLERRLKHARKTRESLDKLIILTKKKLQDSEQQLVNYARSHNVFRLDQGKSLSSEDLEVLNKAYTIAQQARILKGSAFKLQKKSSANIRILDNKVIENLKVNLSSLQAKYANQLQIYKPNYPSLVQLKKQISTLQQQLDRELFTIKSSVNNDLKNNYMAALENEKKIKHQLDKSKNKLIELQDKNIGYDNLQREVETNKTIYEGLLQRVKEIAVAEDIGASNISVVEPAYPAYRQHKPNTMVMLEIGLLTGLVIGSLLAFQLSNNDTRIHKVDDLDGMDGIPVLGVFPLIKTSAAVLLQKSEQDGVVSEAFQALHTKLNFTNEVGMPKVIHVTSSESGEGKTSTAINLATVIEEAGKKVLLIDADMRVPSVHRYLDLANDKGLTDLLMGSEKPKYLIKQIQDTNLDVLPAGQCKDKPAVLLSNQKMISLLNWAVDNYDYTIIDSPPVLSLADSLILSNRASETLFVVSSNTVKKEYILETLKNLKLSYGHVIGFVLNKATHNTQAYDKHKKYYYSTAHKLVAT